MVDILYNSMSSSVSSSGIQSPNTASLLPSLRLDSTRLAISGQDAETKTADLNCSICHEFTLEISECDQCEHIFCDQCLKSWRTIKNECPFKCTDFKTKKPHRVLRQQIESLPFKCENETEGCKKEIQFSLLKRHQLAECEYRMIECEFTGCTEKFLAKNTAQHAENCRFATVLCTTCLTKTLKSEQASHTCAKELTKQILALKLQVEDMDKKHKAQIEELTKNTVPRSEFEDLKAKVAQISNTLLLRMSQQSQSSRDLCHGGHVLSFMEATHGLIQGISCDVCKNSLRGRGIGSYRCQQCDFDRCQTCYVNNRI